MSEAGIALETRNLSVGYKTGRRSSKVVVPSINVRLDHGEFVCLLGPNGAGKSTLLRTIARMQPAISGQTLIQGADLNDMPGSDLAKLLSVVLTDRLSITRLTGYDLISLGRFPHTGWSGRLTASDREIVGWAIEVTHSERLANRDIAEMSDGERQRIMIGRALAQKPSVMLLDEPTAFLDLPTRVEITGLLRRLARDVGLAVLMSAHDLDLAIRSADTIWLMQATGSVTVGAPEDLILNGALESTFTSPELSFDNELGGFRNKPAVVAPVRLEASGLHGLWMRRALERSGLGVTTDDSAFASVSSDEGLKWSVTIDGSTTECTAIADVLRLLNEKRMRTAGAAG